MRRRALGLAIVAAVGLPRSARADDATFALAIDVAQGETGTPVRDPAWIDAQVDAAERLYAPLGVHFRWALAGTLAPRFAALVTRAERDALRPFVRRAAVTVFVVESLADVDEAGRFRMGVCWHHGKDGTRYLILAASAPPSVLAHELGHYFGLHHSTVVDNLMSYSRGDGQVFLDDAQQRTVKDRARVYLRGGHLPDIGPARLLL